MTAKKLYLVETDKDVDIIECWEIEKLGRNFIECFYTEITPEELEVLIQFLMVLEATNLSNATAPIVKNLLKKLEGLNG